MASVNKVILIGHLGKDPQVRTLEGDVCVASFPLATKEVFMKDGKRVEQTEWHNIILWRGLAEAAGKYLRKGKLVYIEGRLRTRIFEDKDKNRRSNTEIVVENFSLLDKSHDHHNSNNQASNDDSQDSDESTMNQNSDNVNSFTV